MLETAFTIVADEVVKKMGEKVVETMQAEVAELPEKLGELSEVELLPDKIEMITEIPFSKKLPELEIPRSISLPLEKVVNDSTEGEYPSTYKERIDRTPSESSERGEWTGERGESTYIPSDEAIKELLTKFGLEGITYTEGIPDFSKCSECTVEIDNMTANRMDNFAQCDEKCAEQWNRESRDRKTDWTARDVKNWRKENGYSWHERNDMKTCDLVPTEVNDYFGHLGGVAECKKRDAAQDIGGEFDE